MVIFPLNFCDLQDFITSHNLSSPEQFLVREITKVALSNFSNGIFNIPNYFHIKDGSFTDSQIRNFFSYMGIDHVKEISRHNNMCLIVIK